MTIIELQAIGVLIPTVGLWLTVLDWWFVKRTKK